MKDLTTSKKYGKVITNPPYGERLGEDDQIRKLYRELAQIKKDLDTWSFYILTAYPHLERVFGQRATKRRTLYNGNIECQYYQYYGPRPPKRSSGCQSPPGGRLCDLICFLDKDHVEQADYNKAHYTRNQ